MINARFANSSGKAVLLIIIFILWGASMTAQSPDVVQLLPQPLPPPDNRQDTQLLNNGDFELDVQNDKIPDGWSRIQTGFVRSDKLKCNTPEKQVAYSGQCAFMFRGNPDGTASNIQQKVNSGLMINGAQIRFSAYINSASAVLGSIFGKTSIKLNNGTAIKLVIRIPANSREMGDYQLVSDQITLTLGDATIKKVSVQFSYRERTGKYLVDAASLIVGSAAETPTPEITATATQDIPTITPSLTFTPSPTVTPFPGQIFANDGDRDDYFGMSVDVDGDTMIVGTHAHIGENVYQGSAYIFVYDGSQWIQQAKLLSPTPHAYGYFGTSVAISFNTAVVSDAYTNAVHVFVRSGTTWTWQDTLESPDPNYGFVFGSSSSVDIDGNRIVIGGGLLGTGKAYTFIRNFDEWTLEQILTASDESVGNDFGHSVALSDTDLIIGAPGDDVLTYQNRGSAYVFHMNGFTWLEQGKLIAPDGKSADAFGSSVAIDGDTVLVGAPGNGNFGEGAAYVFTRTNDTWSLQQKLTTNEYLSDAYVGRAVALNSDRALLGAPSRSKGIAYLFQRSGNAWAEQQTFEPPSAATGHLWFGYSLALNEEATYALIGWPRNNVGTNSSQGSVWFYLLGQ